MEMKKVFSLVLVFLFYVLVSAPSYSQKLSMEEAVHIALKNNEKIMQYNERVIQKDYENKTAFGNFLPSIKFQGSVNHLNDPMGISLDPIREAILQLQSNDAVNFQNLSSLITNHTALTAEQQKAVYGKAYSQLNSALPPFEATFKKQDYWSATLIGIQPIFTGGKMDKKKVADLAKSFSRSCKRLVNEGELNRKIPTPAVTLVAITILNIVLTPNITDKKYWG